MKLRDTIAIALLFTTGLAAQSSITETKEKTRIAVKGGRSITVTGCLHRIPGNISYVVTDDAGDLAYGTVTSENLLKYVDRRIAVRGNAADGPDAKVTIERKVKGATGDKSLSKVQMNSDEVEIPLLALKSIRIVTGSCGR